MLGKVVKLVSNRWTVYDNGKYSNCNCVGKIRYLKQQPIVGDYVEYDDNIIKKILPRRNSLVRPPIANIDVAVVITSCKNPSFSSNLLDKMLVVIEYNNIKPVICFTKYDLLDNKEEIDNIISYYKSIGYKVFINSDYLSINKYLKGKISVFTGQTGVGKSTLLNKLDKDLNLPTNEISKALGRGKHTTRHVELMDVNGALIADTPGFSSLDLINMNNNDIKDNFVEFYSNQHKCKYKDCIHIKEDGCYIKKMVLEGKILFSRYENYKKFIIENNEKR